MASDRLTPLLFYSQCCILQPKTQKTNKNDVDRKGGGQDFLETKLFQELGIKIQELATKLQELGTKLKFKNF